MASIQDSIFFRAQGAKEICAAFLRELKTNGKLETRGDEGIDELVALVNKLTSEPSNNATEKDDSIKPT